jgi:hypothetical protein
MKLILNEFDNVEESGKWFELPENKEYKFKIKPITQADLRKSRSEYTSIRFDKKSHQKIEVEDPEKKRDVTENLVVDCVLDWEGVKEKNDKGKVIDAKFDRDKFKKLLDRNANWKLYVEFNEEEGENEAVTFSGWFMKVALDPSNFVADDTENL